MFPSLVSRSAGGVSVDALSKMTPSAIDDYLLRADQTTLERLQDELQLRKVSAPLHLAVNGHLSLVRLSGTLVVDDYLQQVDTVTFDGNFLPIGKDGDGNDILVHVNSLLLHTPFLHNVYFCNTLAIVPGFDVHEVSGRGELLLALKRHNVLQWLGTQPQLFGTDEAVETRSRIQAPIFRAACGDIYQQAQNLFGSLQTKQVATLQRLLHTKGGNFLAGGSQLARFEVDDADKTFSVRLPRPLRGRPLRSLYTCNYVPADRTDLEMQSSTRESLGYLPETEPALLVVNNVVARALVTYLADRDDTAAELAQELARGWQHPTANIGLFDRIRTFLFGYTGTLHGLQALALAALADFSAIPVDNLPVPDSGNVQVLSNRGSVVLPMHTNHDAGWANGRPVVETPEGPAYYVGGGLYSAQDLSSKDAHLGAVETGFASNALGTALYDVALRADLLFYSSLPELASFCRSNMRSSVVFRDGPAALQLGDTTLPLNTWTQFAAGFSQLPVAPSAMLRGDAASLRDLLFCAGGKYSSTTLPDLSNPSVANNRLVELSQLPLWLVLGLHFFPEKSQLVRFAEEAKSQHAKRQEADALALTKEEKAKLDLASKLRLLGGSEVTFLVSELELAAKHIGVTMKPAVLRWATNNLESVTVREDGSLSARSYAKKLSPGFLAFMRDLVSAATRTYTPAAPTPFMLEFYRFAAAMGLTATSGTHAVRQVDGNSKNVRATRKDNIVTVRYNNEQFVFDLTDLNSAANRDVALALSAQLGAGATTCNYMSSFALTSQNISADLAQVLGQFVTSTGYSPLTTVVALDAAFTAAGFPATWDLSDAVALAFDLTGSGGVMRAVGTWEYGVDVKLYVDNADGAVRAYAKGLHDSDWKHLSEALHDGPDVRIFAITSDDADLSGTSLADVDVNELETNGDDLVLTTSATGFVNMLMQELPGNPPTIDGEFIEPEANPSLFTQSWAVDASLVPLEMGVDGLEPTDETPRDLSVPEFPLVVGLMRTNVHDDKPTDKVVSVDDITTFQVDLLFAHSQFPDHFLALGQKRNIYAAWRLVGKTDPNVFLLSQPAGDISTVLFGKSKSGLTDLVIEYDTPADDVFQLVMELSYNVLLPDGRAYTTARKPFMVSAYFSVVDFESLYTRSVGFRPDYGYGYSITGNVAYDPIRTEEQQARVDALLADNAKLRELKPEAAFDDAVVADVANSRIAYLAEKIKSLLAALPVQVLGLPETESLKSESQEIDPEYPLGKIPDGENDSYFADSVVMVDMARYLQHTESDVREGVVRYTYRNGSMFEVSVPTNGKMSNVRVPGTSIVQVLSVKTNPVVPLGSTGTRANATVNSGTSIVQVLSVKTNPVVPLGSTGTRANATVNSGTTLSQKFLESKEGRAFIASKEGQQYLAQRSARVATLMHLNTRIRELNAASAYDDVLLTSPDADLDSLHAELTLLYNQELARRSQAPSHLSKSELALRQDRAEQKAKELAASRLTEKSKDVILVESNIWLKERVNNDKPPVLRYGNIFKTDAAAQKFIKEEDERLVAEARSDAKDELIAEYDARNEAARLVSYQDVDGFTDGMPELTKARTLKFLNKIRPRGSQQQTIKNFIRDVVRNGAYVENSSRVTKSGDSKLVESLYWQGADGSTYVSDADIGKTGLDYAKFLISRGYGDK